MRHLSQAHLLFTMTTIMARSNINTELSSNSTQYDDDSNNKSILHTCNNVYSKYDRSILSDIDPDINYFQTNNNITSNYFDEPMFNNRFCKSANFSIIHLK